jgi:hypothetical protein
VRSQERLLAEPVLPLLRAWGGVLDAHLGDGHRAVLFESRSSSCNYRPHIEKPFDILAEGLS